MLEQAEDITGQRIHTTLADGGYNTAANLKACKQRHQQLVMPQRYHPGVTGTYFKDRFTYEAETDTYLCPLGQKLSFRGVRQKNGKTLGHLRVYKAYRTVCHSCLAYGTCTKDKHSGRALWIGSRDTLLRRHRRWMATDQAQTLYV